jgi:hypothetical protein
MSQVIADIQTLLRDPVLFARGASELDLRTYQRDVVLRIADSVLNKLGDSICVLFPRQSGKNETQAQIETYLLVIYMIFQAEMIKVSPTWKPQSLNAMNRLERVLTKNIFTRGHWKKEAGFIYHFENSSIKFLSGSPEANIVGATANILLEVDEAQDVTIEKYDKEIAPMVASTNATRVFWGTAWTSQTLLAREIRAAREAERIDGRRRVFLITADDVRAEVHPYGKFVDQQIAKLGRNHPFVRTQYFSEDIDAQAGMFPPARLALMQGDQPGYDAPLPGHTYAFQIDVAGQDEARMGLDASAPLSNPSRDAVSLTITDIDLSTLATLQAPTYRVVYRQQWTGQNHLTILGALKSLGEVWHPLYLVMDATGVGEGLWALLDKTFPGQVLPVKFSQQEKSEIGWRFLAIIETGRFRDCCSTDTVRAQYVTCQSEILVGPAKTLRWSVPESARGPNGELIHDDYLLADSLVAILDRLEWIVQTEVKIVAAPDSLTDMERNF